MSPQDYLNVICRPFVNEFVSNPTAIRSAWAAVTSLCHFEDYLAGERGISIDDQAKRKALRNELDEEFKGFKTIRDVANASKHFIQEKGKKTGARVGLSARHLVIGKGAAFSDGTYFSDGTSFSDINDIVRVEFNGEQIDLVQLCSACLIFLESKL